MKTLGSPRLTMEASIDSIESFDGGSISDDSTNSAARDYSQTNNQVENVDESDIVKNDGKYIYTLSQDKLVIVEAFPAEDMKVVSTIEFKDEIYPTNIFINGDKLVVFTREYKKIEKVSEYDFLPYETRKEFTHIYIYDISNKDKITELKDYSVSGNYDNARMIGETILPNL